MRAVAVVEVTLFLLVGVSTCVDGRSECCCANHECYAYSKIQSYIYNTNILYSALHCIETCIIIKCNDNNVRLMEYYMLCAKYTYILAGM